MEEIGMTDAQWKDNLRMQLQSWEDVIELVSNEPNLTNKEQILKVCERNVTRINKGLED